MEDNSSFIDGGRISIDKNISSIENNSLDRD